MQKERSLTPKVDRNAVIEEMMRSTPRRPRFPEDAISEWLKDNLPHFEGYPSGPTREDLKPKSRTAVPDGAKHLPIRGTDGEQLWWAYNSSKDPEEFLESLKVRGLHLARVTAEDASYGHTQHWAAKRHGRYYPLLGEGEYIVATDRGAAFRLDDRTVGHTVRETKAFMSKLDAKSMPTLREVQNEVHEKRMKEIEREQEDSPRSGPPTERGVSVGRVKRVAQGVLGAPVLVFANAFESLFARSITPEERRLAEVMEHDRQVAAERAEKQRNSGGRDR